MKLNKFKIGLFAFNASSGVTVTTSKNRWQAEWNKIKKVVNLAEQNNLDFLLPLARWNDWGGNTRPHKQTYETFSFTSALASITKKIYLFSTVHTSFVHPIFAARSTSTIENISNGRFGINIVCGWNKSEYDMFNVKSDISSSKRYKLGKEWVTIYEKLLSKNIDKFSYSGEFFKIKNAQCYPKLLNKKNFLKISAAYSEDGRKFATKNCNVLLTMFGNLDNLKENNIKLFNMAKKNNNKISIFTPIHIVCKNTDTEAKEFYEQYSNHLQDRKAVNNFIGNLEWAKKSKLGYYLRHVKQKVAGSLGAYTIVGNPNKVAEILSAIKANKVNGVAMTFFDYDKDLRFFIKNVLPKISKF